MADPGHLAVYACSCLNVRVHPSPPPASPTETADSSNFLHVYVGEDGIAVVRPHTLGTHGSAAGRTLAARRVVAQAELVLVKIEPHTADPQDQGPAL